MKNAERKQIFKSKMVMKSVEQKLVFRIKEVVHFYKNHEYHKFYPQVKRESVDWNNYNIKSFPAGSDDPSWANLTDDWAGHGGCLSFEKAFKICLNTIPYVDRYETIIHEVKI